MNVIKSILICAFITALAPQARAEGVKTDPASAAEAAAREAREERRQAVKRASKGKKSPRILLRSQIENDQKSGGEIHEEN